MLEGIRMILDFVLVPIVLWLWNLSLKLNKVDKVNAVQETEIRNLERDNAKLWIRLEESETKTDKELKQINLELKQLPDLIIKRIKETKL
jgi:hypothetical protein